MMKGNNVLINGAGPHYRATASSKLSRINRSNLQYAMLTSF